MIRPGKEALRAFFRRHEGARLAVLAALLELLQYDLLYGDREAYGGAALQPTHLQMGLAPVEVHYAMTSPRGLWVLGSGVTEWSTVTLDGDEQDTLFVNPWPLQVAETLPEEPCELTARQAGKDRQVLSESRFYHHIPLEEEQP